MAQTRRTILRPDYKTKREGPTLRDYISVPRIALIGTFPLVQMLDQRSAVNLLRLYNQLNEKRA